MRMMNWMLALVVVLHVFAGQARAVGTVKFGRPKGLSPAVGASKRDFIVFLYRNENGSLNGLKEFTQIVPIQEYNLMFEKPQQILEGFELSCFPAFPGFESMAMRPSFVRTVMVNHEPGWHLSADEHGANWIVMGSDADPKFYYAVVETANESPARRIFGYLVKTKIDSTGAFASRSVALIASAQEYEQLMRLAAIGDRAFAAYVREKRVVKSAAATAHALIQ